ncbi:UDP-2,4-diacetamido-2,4,6-trideoxy-beta-L-altropyranose hydrolase [Janthinobacterium sp. CG_S6]|uniref:UDP-2,4-diacetamido-2,4, 6-trideoxy-beta-L-altropyranose hydrolase n=1 Tax=Janthinobacterium sp. CG_S6 TaxID=3071707 RepID=UPI002E167961
MPFSPCWGRPSGRGGRATSCAANRSSRCSSCARAGPLATIIKVAIRADASAQIGTGHVMRCLTLANEIRRLGAQVYFLSRDLPAHLAQALRQSGHTLLPLAAATPVASDEPAHAAWLGTSWQRDAEACAAVLAPLGDVAWLVLDQYALDARWESALRPAVGRILVIDDLADRAHDCDILLDQNFYADQAARYEGKTAPGTALLLGSHYALLRPEFGRIRAAADLAGVAPGAPRRLNICFGGADAGGETLKVVRALDGRFAAADLLVDIVVGPSNPHQAAIRDWARRRPYLQVHLAPSGLAELMAAADIGIGAAGSMSWERACVGLPSIAIAVAENQFRLGGDAAAVGMHVFLGRAQDLGEGELLAAFDLLIANAYLRQAFVAAGKKMVDGQGAARVARRLVGTDLGLRAAQPEDCAALYQWRNAPENRRHAHQSGQIAYADHQRWFADSLDRDDRHLLIGYDAHGPVGVLRYDKHIGSWLTSIYLAPGRHGAGLGRKLIEQGIEWMRARHGPRCQIQAEIKMDNIASQRVFMQAGYIASFTTYTIVA